MQMNDIYISQGVSKCDTGEIRTVYHLFTPNNIYIGAVMLPHDCQYLFDSKILGIISRALAIRWRVIPIPKKF